MGFRQQLVLGLVVTLRFVHQGRSSWRAPFT